MNVQQHSIPVPTRAIAKEWFTLVSDMETKIRTAQNVTLAIDCIAEARLEDVEGCALCELATLVENALTELEESRRHLFHAMHPFVYGARPTDEAAA